MKYNTQQNKLILPEYGRNIQSMVNYAMTIEDREERTRCANTIIQIMGNLFPHLRDVEEFNHKLWDHLAVMSDFKLDIDYPYEIIKEENLFIKPDKVKYQSSKIRYRHYGKLLQNMLEKTVELDESPEKESVISLIANHMKRSYIKMTNENDIDNYKICKDIREYTNNKIIIEPNNLKLDSSKSSPQKKNKNNSRKAVR